MPGPASYVLRTTEDVSARKAAEQALRESEERPRLALEGAQQGTYDLDVKSGKRLVSPEYATMLGYDPSTFTETNAAWIARLHDEDRERVAQQYHDYVAGHVPVYTVEFRQRTRDGGWKWNLSRGPDVGHAHRHFRTQGDGSSRRYPDARVNASLDGSEYLEAVVISPIRDSVGHVSTTWA